MARARRKRSNPGEGKSVEFHGAFGTKKKARAKEQRTRGAWIVPRKIRGETRYLVLSEKRPTRRRTAAKRNPMKFLVNPDRRRAKPRGKAMARRSAPRYKSGPKKGQFMPKRARKSKRRRARRNPGATVAASNPRRRRRRSPARRRSAPRAAPRRRRRARRNPPKMKGLVRTFTDGAIEAGEILVGKAVVRSVPDLLSLPKEGNVGLAVQAGVAIAAGYIAEWFLSREAARAIVAGGLTAPLETAIVAYKVPWLSRALSPVTTTQNLGAYVSGATTLSGRRMGAYVRGELPARSDDRGLGAYASARRG